MSILYRALFISLILGVNSFAISQDNNSPSTSDSEHKLIKNFFEYASVESDYGLEDSENFYSDCETIHPSTSTESWLELTKEEEVLLISLMLIKDNLKKETYRDILCRIQRLSTAINFIYNAEHIQYHKNTRDKKNRLLREFELLKERFIHGDNPVVHDLEDLEAGNERRLELEHLRLVFNVVTNFPKENDEILDCEHRLLRAALQFACEKILDDQVNIDDHNMFLFSLVHKLQTLEITNVDISYEQARELLGVASEVDLDEEAQVNFVYSILSFVYPHNILPTSFLQWYLFLDETLVRCCKRASIAVGSGGILIGSVLLAFKLACGDISDCDANFPRFF